MIYSYTAPKGIINHWKIYHDIQKHIECIVSYYASKGNTLLPHCKDSFPVLIT